MRLKTTRQSVPLAKVLNADKIELGLGWNSHESRPDPIGAQSGI